MDRGRFACGRGGSCFVKRPFAERLCERPGLELVNLKLGTAIAINDFAAIIEHLLVCN